MEQITIEQVQKVLEGFQETGAMIWASCLKQVYINGIIYACVSAIFLVILLFFIWLIRDGEPTEKNDQITVLVGFWFFFVPFALFFSFAILGVCRIVNPEYYAVVDILQKIKN